MLVVFACLFLGMFLQRCHQDALKKVKEATKQEYRRQLDSLKRETQNRDEVIQNKDLVIEEKERQLDQTQVALDRALHRSDSLKAVLVRVKEDYTRLTVAFDSLWVQHDSLRTVYRQVRMFVQQEQAGESEDQVSGTGAKQGLAPPLKLELSRFGKMAILLLGKIIIVTFLGAALQGLFHRRRRRW